MEDDDTMGMRYFGPIKPTALPASAERPAPVGERCSECGEVFTEKSQGWLLHRMGTGVSLPLHHPCLLVALGLEAQ